MNKWIKLIFWLLISVRKAKCYYEYAHGQISLWPFRSCISKICFISRINWWTTACCHYSANEMHDKNKKWTNERKFFTFHWLQNNIIFFCKKHINNKHQADLWFKEQQFLVLKGVKRKKNIRNGSPAEWRALLLPNPYIHTNEKQYLPPFCTRQPPRFYKKIMTLTPSMSFQKSQPLINRGLRTY